MAVHDYVIDNSTGANVRADINNALLAIVSNNSSSSEPSTTKYAYMWWADTTNGILKIRNSANDGWVELLQLDGTLTLEDGTVSAPGLAFRDDLNTGVFSSAADTFNVATGGVERMELGTTTIFNEDGADVDFRIEGDTNANLFYVDAGNDRVGIGLSSPDTLFHVNLAAENGSIAQFGLSGQTNNQSFVIKADDSDSLFTFRFGSSNSTYPAIRFNMGADVEAFRIDKSGNVGVGVVPEAVQYSGYNFLQVGESAALSSNDTQSDTNITNLTQNTYLDATASNWKYLHTDEATRYQQYNGQHHFSVASSGSADANVSFSQKLTIDTDGLKFNGDTSSGNALNDYEEGTYTPTITFASDDGNKVYASRGGSYTKIGRKVTVNININLSNRGTGSGLATVSLPFTVGDRLANTAFEGGGFAYYFINLLSSVSNIILQARENTTTAELRGVLATSSANMADFGYNFVSNSTEFRLTVTYFT